MNTTAIERYQTACDLIAKGVKTPDAIKQAKSSLGFYYKQRKLEKSSKPKAPRASKGNRPTFIDLTPAPTKGKIAIIICDDPTQAIEIAKGLNR